MNLRLKTLSIIALLTIIFSQNSFSHNNEPRHEAMVTLAKNMKEISRINKTNSSFDDTHIEKIIQVYEISKKMDILFDKDDSNTKDSRASPNIWVEKDKFISISKGFEKSIQNLLSAVKSNDREKIDNAISKVGSNCGKCHRAFRLPKKN